jgi:hypothetical protein
LHAIGDTPSTGLDSAHTLHDRGEDGLAAAPADTAVAAVLSAAAERDEQRCVVGGLAEDAGALAFPAQDRARRADGELDGAAAVALAVTDVQRAKLPPARAG